MLDKSIIIDYLTFTVTVNKNDEEGRGLLLKGQDLPNLDLIIEILGLSNEWKHNLFAFKGGMLGYSESHHYNGCVICEPSDKKHDMGYCFSMSGNGCRFLESKKAFEWTKLFKRLFKLDNLGYKVNFTRLDLAVDDYSGVLDMDKIFKYAQKGNFCSTARKNTIVRSFFDFDNKGNNLGKTVYFGSKSSDRYIRIYDKLSEQKSKGAVIDENVEQWTRLECVFKRQYALQMILAYIDLKDNFGEFFSDVVNGQLRFLKKREENVTRSKTVGWWSKFIGTVKEFKLTKGETCVKAIDKMARFLLEKASASFVAVTSVYGRKFMDSFVNNGADKINDRHMYAVKTAGCFSDNIINMDIVQRAKDNLLMRGFEEYAI